jgi:hypothetical protein
MPPVARAATARISVLARGLGEPVGPGSLVRSIQAITGGSDRSTRVAMPTRQRRAWAHENDFAVLDVRRACHPDPRSEGCMSDQIRRLQEALATADETVELDIEAHRSSANMAAVIEMSQLRFARITAGERVARIFGPNKFGHRERRYEANVTHDEAIALLANGARWVGPRHQDPRDRLPDDA